MDKKVYEIVCKSGFPIREKGREESRKRSILRGNEKLAPARTTHTHTHKDGPPMVLK